MPIRLVAVIDTPSKSALFHVAVPPGPHPPLTFPPLTLHPPTPTNPPTLAHTHPHTHTLQKCEACFNQLWLHQLQCACNNTILEAHRSFSKIWKQYCTPFEYPLTQLLQECATWNLPNYCHWKAIKKIFKLC